MGRDWTLGTSSDLQKLLNSSTDELKSALSFHFQKVTRPDQDPCQQVWPVDLRHQFGVVLLLVLSLIFELRVFGRTILHYQHYFSLQKIHQKLSKIAIEGSYSSP